MMKMKILVLTAFMLMLAVSLVSGQQVGARGVSKLGDNELGRDEHTLQASRNVARFAKQFQPFLDKIADVCRRMHEYRPAAQNSVLFSSSYSLHAPVGRQEATEVFDSLQAEAPNKQQRLRLKTQLEM